MSDWRPGADRQVLQARAALLAALRRFFAQRDVMEVETPLLCRAGVTDPSLEALVVETAGGRRFLQTSPEYAMKRLLAAGSGDIYQISKAFRADEFGQRHNPEYTLLEWYRLDFDHRQLAREVAELICEQLARPGWQVWSYRSLFRHVLDVDPIEASLTCLEEMAQHRAGLLPDGLDRDGVLDLLMVTAIEPALCDWGVVVVTDYPASQAALARTASVAGHQVGCRFECYVDGVELANGYWELGDPDELRSRFVNDNLTRECRGLPVVPIDERLLAAHQSGLPPCAGVALGVDRLLAVQQGIADIRTTMSFDWQRS